MLNFMTLFIFMYFLSTQNYKQNKFILKIISILNNDATMTPITILPKIIGGRPAMTSQSSPKFSSFSPPDENFLSDFN